MEFSNSKTLDGRSKGSSSVKMWEHSHKDINLYINYGSSTMREDNSKISIIQCSLSFGEFDVYLTLYKTKDRKYEKINKLVEEEKNKLKIMKKVSAMMIKLVSSSELFDLMRRTFEDGKREGRNELRKKFEKLLEPE